MIKKAVIALIEHEGDILMGQRKDSGKWTSPGGCVEPKETPWDALIREVKEETGLVVTDYKMVDVSFEKKCLCYLYKVKVKGKIDFSDDPDQEFKKMAYVDPQKVDLHYPESTNIVLKYLKGKND
jgi:8-oxo-dGTP diphosphatase